MIDRDPPQRDANGVRKPDQAVLLNLGAGCSRIPAIAVLPPALERRMVALRKPVSGESRLRGAAKRKARIEAARQARRSGRDT